MTGALTIEDIHQMIQEGDACALAQCVLQAGRDLPGSKPFWQKAQRDLIAQIRSPECHSPHMFFTASADIQWPDMHQHMPNNVQGQPEDAHSYRVWMKDLNENPAIAGYYFQKRWNIFFENYMKPIFKVTDYWWRHIHGFLWMKDAPQIDDLDTQNPIDLQRFVDFWDKYVSTWHPDVNAPPAAIHPSA